MAFFSNIRLSTRIYAQMFVLLIAVVVIASFSLYGVKQIVGETTEIESINLPMAKSMASATIERLRQNLNFERIVRYGTRIHNKEDKQARAAFDRNVGRAKEHNANVLKMLDEARVGAKKALDLTPEDDKSYREQLTKVVDTINTFEKGQIEQKEVLDKIIADFEAGRDDEAVKAGEDREQVMLASNIMLEEFVTEMQELESNPVASVNQVSGRLTTHLLAIGLVSTAIAIIMVIFTGMTLTQLRRSMGNIGNSVQQVASAASQSSNAISVVADGSKQQSEAISQAVTAVSQSAVVLNDVSRSAEDATELSKQTATTVNEGRAQMTKMSDVVSRIAVNSSRINKITDVINNIASQTNMLSLNAAIEAARAGEHGKGFAVVAEQVRRLAESSRNSVQDIVELAQQAARDASEAVAATDRVGDEMSKISTAATETERMMQSIATAMEEQVATVEELQHNMDTLKSIGNNNANAAEEITQTILELSHIADDTNMEVRKFNI